MHVYTVFADFAEWRRMGSYGWVTMGWQRHCFPSHTTQQMTALPKTLSNGWHLKPWRTLSSPPSQMWSVFQEPKMITTAGLLWSVSYRDHCWSWGSFTQWRLQYWKRSSFHDCFQLTWILCNFSYEGEWNLDQISSPMYFQTQDNYKSSVICDFTHYNTLSPKVFFLEIHGCVFNKISIFQCS